MFNKVAKLVTLSMEVRVIVDENSTRGEAIRKALNKAVENLESHGGEFVDNISNDDFDPYNPEFDYD